MVVAVKESAATKTGEGAPGPPWDKSKLVAYFVVKGIVHLEFVPSGIPENSDFIATFRGALEKMCDEKDWKWRNHQ